MDLNLLSVRLVPSFPVHLCLLGRQRGQKVPVLQEILSLRVLRCFLVDLAVPAILPPRPSLAILRFLVLLASLGIL